MLLTKHNFFDPIIPYITEMNYEVRTIVIEVPSSLALDVEGMEKYIKDYIVLKTTTSDVWIKSTTTVLSGKIKDKEIFDYLFFSVFGKINNVEISMRDPNILL